MYQFVYQGQLDISGYLVVEVFDLVELVWQVEYVVDDYVGFGDVGCVYVGGFFQVLYEGDVYVVDQVVGDLCVDDFVFQVMVVYGVVEFFCQ